MMQKLLKLLQVNDSMFPIGSFTHSYGLESYVSSRQVCDGVSAEKYARNMLEHNIYYNDAAFLNKTLRLTGGKSYWHGLTQLDGMVTALKAPFEIKNASRKLAIRFLKLTMHLEPTKYCNQYLDEIGKGILHGHYAIAFGLYAKACKMERADALAAFYYNTLNGIVTNCAKMIPISQTVAQKILSDLFPTIEALVNKQDMLDDAYIGLCCIGQEIKCMQHEKLYTRIYIS